MQGNYSIQYLFLRFWLFLLSDNSNPLLGFLHSHCSTSLLSSPQSSCIFPRSLQLHLFIFSPSLPLCITEDTCFPFCHFFFSISNCGHWTEKVLTLASPLLCHKPKCLRYLFGSCWKAPRYQPHFLRLNFPSWFISSTLFLCAEEGDISNNSLLSKGGKKANCLKSEGWM